MRFIQHVDIDKFDLFVVNHPTKSHFMQSAAWGEFNKVQRGMEPYYCGLENDNGELVAATLLLLKKPPLFPPYFYAPRGFVIDFDDKELLAEMVKGVKSLARQTGAMFLKIDPDVEIHQLDTHGNPIENAPDKSYVVDTLVGLGFRHHGFNKEFDGSQPRYSFRIDLSDDEKVIKKRITGNVIKNINKGEKHYPATIRKGSTEDIHDLYRLITLTSERDEFFGYDETYYRNFFEILGKRNMSKLWIGSVNASVILESLKKQLKDTENALLGYKKEHHINEAKLTIDRLNREIETFEKYSIDYPGDTVISAHLVVHYGKHAWAVHAGSAGIMNETFINNRVYWNKIIKEKEEGVEWLDQFGTIGNPDESHLASLHAFKKQFGGRYVEFAGEFDLPFNLFWYNLYVNVLPKYRNIRFTIKEHLRKLKTR